MSDIQLKLEIKKIVNASGHKKSKDLICPISRIVAMRHGNISHEQILKITKEIL